MLRQLPAPPCPSVIVFVPRPLKSGLDPICAALPGYNPNTGERYRQLPELPPPAWFCWPPRPIRKKEGCWHPDDAPSFVYHHYVSDDGLDRTCVYHHHVRAPLIVCEDEKRAWALCDVLNQRGVDPLLYIPFLGSEGILDPSEIPSRPHHL